MTEESFNSLKIFAVKAIRIQGVDESYIKVLEDIYKVSTATVKLHKLSEIGEVTKKCKERNRDENALHHMERKRPLG